MTNTNTDKDRFLSVFRREWEMHLTRECEPARMQSDTPRRPSHAKFDQPVAAGELRILADYPSPVSVLLIGVSAKGWRVVPVSPFTVPASDREILIGTRVFQLWNATDLPAATVSRSWIVDTSSPEDLADVKTALNAKRDDDIPADLLDCMGLPIEAADDPRRDYERTYRLTASASTARRRSVWRYLGLAFAASLLLAVGLPVLFIRERSSSVILPNVNYEVPPEAARRQEPLSERLISRMTAVREESYVQREMTTDMKADTAMNIQSPVMMKSVMGSSRNTRSLRSEPSRDGAYEHVPRAVPRADAAETERFAAFKENEFLDATSNPLSTFGLDVDTASYTTMRRYLVDMRRLPPRDSVRIEEYVNYFSYDYAGPTGAVPVAVACELGACPWNMEHKLLRVGVQAKRVAKESIPPCNLVFLIDKSGSMNCNGGFAMLVQSLRLLVKQLRAEDSVAIVSYASGVQVELPAVSGADKARILQVLDGLRAGGATSGGEGLQLAYDQAMKNFSAKKNNRVVLVTDGDFNVGIRDPSELERYIAAKRETGVFLTVLGVGRGNYQDAMMKKLANAGNGNYAFLDSILEAKKVLINEFGGTMMTVAKDVKLQLEFNPAQVSAYRLLGYENRLLAAKDFNDDKKDAGEMGSGHSMTAFYEIVPVGATNVVAKTDSLKYQKQVPVASGELLTAKLRYKLPDANASTRIDQPIVTKDITPSQPTESFRFASAVAEFALLMKDSAYKGSASFDAVIERARTAKGKDVDGWRAEFIRLAETAQLLKASAPDRDVAVDPGL